jgi:hypothetical protein
VARKHKPDLPNVNLVLANCLCTCYLQTLDDELMDEVASILDGIIASGSPRDIFVAHCQKIILLPVMFLLMVDNHPENSKDAIYCAHAFLTSSSVEDPLYPTWSCILECAAKNCFVKFGPINGLEASSSNSIPFLLVPADNSVLTSKWDCLHDLLDRIWNNNITDIDEAIELGRSILASSDASSHLSDLLVPQEFSGILLEAFEHTNKIEFLNELIATLHQIFVSLLPKIMHFTATAKLVKSLYVSRIDL